MALYKEIKQADGVTTKYHRILFIRNTINQYISIAVLSYVDEESRLNEKNSADSQPYNQSVVYQIEYDSSMTIEKAYEYLKTLPQFEGAEDI